MIRLLLLLCLCVPTHLALAQTVLSSGVPAPFHLPPQGSSALFNGDQGFRVDVPEDAAGLLVHVTTLRAEGTLAFHLRRDADVEINGGLTADMSVTESNDGRIWTLEAQTLPSGTYFIAFTAGPFAQDLRGVIYAEVLDSPAPAMAEIDVPGLSQIMLAGQPAGTVYGNSSNPQASAPENSPVLALVNFVPGQRIRFVANGTIDSRRVGNNIPPEGHRTSDSPGGQFGLSGINGPRDALTGVFLGDVIDADNAPPNLQYEGGATEEELIEPMLQQTFYIGSGFTAAGVQREFIVPDGATRLFLGTKAQFPNNNTGSFHALVTTHPASPPPISQNPVIVPAISHLSLAGQPVGTVQSFQTVPLFSPPQANVALQGGRRLQFRAWGEARIRNRGLVPASGANVNANAGLSNGFSGLVAPQGSVAGVFTADVVDENLQPTRLTFDADLRDEPLLQPVLQQMFYIGDGFTESGERRTVVVPEGATHLYLAVHDSNNRFNEGGFFVVVSVDDAAAPVLAVEGVTNGASFSSGPVVPGGIASIFGENLSGATVVNESIPMATSLGGVQVFFDRYVAPLYFVSAGQINAQVPWELRGHVSATITVVNNGIVGDPIEVDVAPFDPGIFDVPNLGPIVINNSTGRLVSAEEPATSGDALIIYATGLGPVAPGVASGFPPPPVLTNGTFPVEAILTGNGQQTTINPFFVGGAPGFVGVIQVNLILTDEVPTGSVLLRLQSPGFGATQEVQIFVD